MSVTMAVILSLVTASIIGLLFGSYSARHRLPDWVVAVGVIAIALFVATWFSP